MTASEPAAIDVGVVGAGIVGCSVAAHLAQAGVSVALFDEEGVGARASGRNSGAVEHPYDEVQRPLYGESVQMMRELGVAIPERPVGVLLLGGEREAVAAVSDTIETRHPELEPRLVDPEEVAALEPGVAPGHWACRIETGFPVPPRVATQLYAELAERSGARVEVGARAAIVWDGTACVGLRVGEREVATRSVVVAAGAASSRFVDPSGRWAPIAASWGVNLEIRLATPPRHMLIEAALVRVQTGEAPAVDQAFSLISAGERNVLGSTFVASEPSPEDWEARIVERGARFVPAVEGAPISARLACPRPASVDGRPLLGHVAGAENLLIGSGNGGRGLSMGAACGRAVAEALLRGSDDLIPAPLRASRFPLTR